MQKKIAEFTKHTILFIIIMMSMFPFYMMVNISLKNNVQFTANPWFPTAPYHWENYLVGWDKVGPTILNTAFVGITTTVLTMGIALIGAFFFARLKMPGSKMLFFIFIILMMYPGIANLVPTFKLVASLGLYNSYWSLILLGTAGAQAFTIYVLRNFIEEIPQDLFDASEIDGCSIPKQIWFITLPMCAPIIGTLGVLKIVTEWNRFVAPLVFIRDNERQMLAVSLLHLEGENVKNWGEMMAGYTIASIPLVLLFFFCMRLFIRGMSEGAVKG